MLLQNLGKNKRKLRCGPWSAGWVGSVARARLWVRLIYSPVLRLPWCHSGEFGSAHGAPTVCPVWPGSLWYRGEGAEPAPGKLPC